MSRDIIGIYNGMPEYIEYILLPEERIEEALAVRNDAIQRSNVILGVGVDCNNANSIVEMDLVVREIIKDRYSIIAVETKTNQIVGVCFNKIHIQPKNGELSFLEKFVKNNIKDEASLAVMDFILYAESRVNIFQHYNTRCVLEIYFVGTHSRYGGRGIGLNLMKTSIELGRNLGKGKFANDVGNGIVAPEVVFGIFTSNFSQQMASRLKFDWLATVSYDNYLCRGKKMSEKIGDTHKTTKLGALRIV